MSRRSVRLLLVLLALAAAAAAIDRGLSNERTRQELIAAARATERAAEETLAQVAELRASLHAYVAAGQGEAFWMGRAATLFDGIRTRVLQLDGANPGGATGELLDGIDRLAAADKRARDLIAEGQTLMAGDVIFIEARDLADALNRQVSTTRSAAARAGGDRESALIREQYLLAGGALGAWVVVALLLLPRTAATPAAAASGVLHVVPQREVSDALDAPDMKLNEGFDEPLNLTLATDEAPVALPAHPAPRTAHRAPPHLLLSELASICRDLARVTDVASLGPVLARAAAALDATGVILWMAASDGDLHPAAAHGYEAALLARLGPVRRGAGNLTAAVFRDGAPRTAAASVGALAAVAVPVVGAAGTIGVLSAELTPAADTGHTVAAASIVAAQLATLLGTPAGPESAAVADGPAVRLTGS